MWNVAVVLLPTLAGEHHATQQEQNQMMKHGTTSSSLLHSVLLVGNVEQWQWWGSRRQDTHGGW